MNEQQKTSVRAVLSAALHNTKTVKDQLESLSNPQDESFKDVPMDQAIKEVDDAVKSIQKALDELDG